MKRASLNKIHNGTKQESLKILKKMTLKDTKILKKKKRRRRRRRRRRSNFRPKDIIDTTQNLTWGTRRDDLHLHYIKQYHDLQYIKMSKNLCWKIKP